MKTKLIDKKQVAQDTISFYFAKPINFNYFPGQFIYLTLSEVTNDYRGPTRQFTLASSPTEEYLMITTRIRDESQFKQSLANLKAGAEVEIEGPSGTFILDEKEPGNHVLLAGGIGITPFRSILKYNFDKKLTDIKLHLIYANKTPELIAFRNELTKYITAENIKVDFCISRPEESSKEWTGLTGHIDEKMLKNILTPPLNNLKYWLCGPPGMVDALFMSLSKLKISGKNIYSEKFTGY